LESRRPKIKLKLRREIGIFRTFDKSFENLVGGFP
jgi:hypothetical protein